MYEKLSKISKAVNFRTCFLTDRSRSELSEGKQIYATLICHRITSLRLQHYPPCFVGLAPRFPKYDENPTRICTFMIVDRKIPYRTKTRKKYILNFWKWLKPDRFLFILSKVRHLSVTYSTSEQIPNNSRSRNQFRSIISLYFFFVLYRFYGTDKRRRGQIAIYLHKVLTYFVGY